MHRTLMAVRRALRPDGIAAFVIGDVAKPGRPSLALARQLWSDTGPSTGLQLVDLIEDELPRQNKVSRIWGETKGQATDLDCVLVLARADGDPRPAAATISWEEPYKDAGPDAAHAQLRRIRRVS
jgi:site-specific DNA-methyltransferase (adenine-specific)